MARLADLGFIGLKPGPIGDLSYAVFYNPYHIVKRAFLDGKVQERKWQALIIRANEVGAFDIDDIDDQGKLVPPEEEEAKTRKTTIRLAGKRMTKKANPG